VFENKVWFDFSKMLGLLDRLQGDPVFSAHMNLVMFHAHKALHSAGLSLEQIGERIANGGELPPDVQASLSQGQSLVDTIGNIPWTEDMLTQSLLSCIEHLGDTGQSAHVLKLDERRSAIVTDDLALTQAIAIGADIAQKRGE
jgi:hypothetical protein